MAVLLYVGVWGRASAADADRCAICQGEFGNSVYTLTDKVTGEKKQVCYTCTLGPEECFLCGLPVKKDFIKLLDGRFLCARDGRTAVLKEEEAEKVCWDAKDELERLLSRYTTFPGTNLCILIADKVNLQKLFKVPGRNYECPNVLGYYITRTNGGKIAHEISLLSGLPLAECKAVCAHELTHAWIAENLSPQRQKSLGHDGDEGFCELLAYLLMESQQEQEQMKAIRRNNYTRGQVDLFIEAEKRFGLNAVLEWMKYGTAKALSSEDPNVVREIETPGAKEAARIVAQSKVYYRVKTPSSLGLNGISWTQNRPLALINGTTFEPGERGKVQVGDTTVSVICVQIRTNSVVIEIEGAKQTKELFLGESKR